MDRDASALLQVAGMIERRTPLGVSVRPLDLAQEFIDNVDEELDFTAEAANARALVAATPAELRTRVPVVFEQYSSTTVLVEERLIGASVADVDALRHSGHDPAELADRLLRVMVHHIFEIGVFHADPHPGNVLVLDDGWLGLIDLGAVGRLGPAEQEALRAMLVAMYVGDVSALRATLMDVCIVQPDVQTTLLDSALQQLLSQGIREGGFTAATFEDLVTLVGEYGIRPPRWFATLGRTLITLEGTLHSIDPNFSLVDAVQQQVQSRIAGSHDHEGLREAVQKEALVQLPRLRRLPGRIDELLDQAAAGRLRAGVSIFSDPRDERIVTRLVNRAVLGILAASLAVGSTVLIGVDSGPAFTDSVTLNEVLGYIGLAVGTVLALRVIASIIRDGT
jgi:ubiquinone biosynthesis protein